MSDILCHYRDGVTFKNTEASATIPANSVAVVDTATAGGAKLPAGASSTASIAGFTESPVVPGEPGVFYRGEVVWLRCTAAAIAIGDKVVIGDANGRIMAKPADATTQGISIVGTALEACSGTVDTIIAVLAQIQSNYAS